MRTSKQVSLDAYNFAKKKFRKTKHSIMLYIYMIQKPVTYHEVKDFLEMDHNASSRLGELRRSGLLQYDGRDKADKCGIYSLTHQGIEYIQEYFR